MIFTMFTTKESPIMHDMYNFNWFIRKYLKRKQKIKLNYINSFLIYQL